MLHRCYIAAIALGRRALAAGVPELARRLAAGVRGAATALGPEAAAELALGADLVLAEAALAAGDVAGATSAAERGVRSDGLTEGAEAARRRGLTAASVPTERL